MRTIIISLLVLTALTASAQLQVTISPLRRGGQKVSVPLTISNGFPEAIRTIRATAFLQYHDKAIGQSTRWIIEEKNGIGSLAPRATNCFNFVMSADRGIPTTNISARLIFNRVVLMSGKLVDANKKVSVTTSK